MLKSPINLAIIAFFSQTPCLLFPLYANNSLHSIAGSITFFGLDALDIFHCVLHTRLFVTHNNQATSMDFLNRISLSMKYLLAFYLILYASLRFWDNISCCR